MNMSSLVRRVVLMTVILSVFLTAVLAQTSNGANDEEQQNVEKLQMKRKIEFLEDYHVDQIKEESGQENLMYHLRGVSKMLKDWGLPPHVQDAGLFHSVFGTEVFPQQAVPDTDRPLVRELIGEQAEALTWIFGNMNRGDFYQLVKKVLAEKVESANDDEECFILPCTVHGDGDRAQANRETIASTSEKCELHVSRQQIPDVAVLTLANLLEQAPRFPDPDMQAWTRNELNWQLNLFRPLLPEKACMDVEHYQGRANPGNCNMTTSIPDLFPRVENDLRHPKYGNRDIPFNFRLYDDQNLQDKVPTSLPIPDFVRVFELNEEEAANRLGELGRAARDIIDANLPSSGAVLFRNLHYHITNAVAFQQFWNKVMESEQKGDWKYHPYNPAYNSPYRPQLDGVDTANNVRSEVMLRMHNEMAYNPTHPSRVGFYCLREGLGGETMLGLNAEFTKNVPDQVKPFIEAHGGILYERFYLNDSDSEEKHVLSWQGKTGATTREDAIAYYTELGWKEEDITFDENGGMSLRFVHRGYLLDEESGEDLWYNFQQNIAVPMADGTEMPREMISQIEIAQWKSAYGLRLRPGDWLVLDNLRVMHGRFPYQDINPKKPRTLLVVYTD